MRLRGVFGASWDVFVRLDENLVRLFASLWKLGRLCASLGKRPFWGVFFVEESRLNGCVFGASWGSLFTSV